MNNDQEASARRYLDRIIEIDKQANNEAPSVSAAIYEEALQETINASREFTERRSAVG